MKRTTIVTKTELHYLVTEEVSDRDQLIRVTPPVAWRPDLFLFKCTRNVYPKNLIVKVSSIFITLLKTYVIMDERPFK